MKVVWFLGDRVSGVGPSLLWVSTRVRREAIR
jgi:hypothetical protein